MPRSPCKGRGGFITTPEDEEYKTFTDQTYEVPFLPDDEPEEKENEGVPHRRRRIQHYKSEKVMMQECHDRVMAGKRLTKLQSRWMYNRFEHCHTYALSSMPLHNRTVDELRDAQKRVWELERKLAQLTQEEGQ